MTTIESTCKVRDRMPILNKLVDRYRDQKPFQDVTVLYLQHQLENQFAEASAMIELGLDPKKLYWIDIPYTSHKVVRDAVMTIGVPQNNFFIHDCKLTTRYQDYQRKRVQDWIKDFLPKFQDGKKMLVLDDGAYFLEAIVCFKDRFPDLRIVEQTTRGMIKLRKNAAMRSYRDTITFVNVASSRPKKEIEPRFIGKSVTSSLIGKLNKFRDRIISVGTTKCLILGYGSIGAAVATSISESFGLEPGDIYVYDPSPDSQERARKKGYILWNKDDLTTKFNLVVGCSGSISFTIGDHIFLEDGAFLTSASSGSSELSREQFIELADTVIYDDIYVVDRDELEDKSIHTEIEVQFPHTRATFINGGFPVNFDGVNIEGVPAEDIQITIAMMVMGAVQAVTTEEKGLIPLDETFCDWLIDEYTKS
jgi:S-adenosylhomocysteine hydrolase